MPPDNKLRAPTMGSSSNSLYILAGLARRAGTAGCRKPALVTKPCPEGNFQCELTNLVSSTFSVPGSQLGGAATGFVSDRPVVYVSDVTSGTVSVFRSPTILAQNTNLQAGGSIVATTGSTSITVSATTSVVITSDANLTSVSGNATNQFQLATTQNIINNGTITGGIIDLHAMNGTFTNFGTITANTGLFLIASPTLINNGLMQVTGTGPLEFQAPSGVLSMTLGANSALSNTVANGGIIFNPAGGTSITLTGPGAISSNSASGSIEFVASDGAAINVNVGRIDGSVDFGKVPASIFVQSAAGNLEVCGCINLSPVGNSTGSGGSMLFNAAGGELTVLGSLLSAGNGAGFSGGNISLLALGSVSVGGGMQTDGTAGANAGNITIISQTGSVGVLGIGSTPVSAVATGGGNGGSAVLSGTAVNVIGIGAARSIDTSSDTGAAGNVLLQSTGTLPLEIGVCQTCSITGDIHADGATRAARIDLLTNGQLIVDQAMTISSSGPSGRIQISRSIPGAGPISVVNNGTITAPTPQIGATGGIVGFNSGPSQSVVLKGTGSVQAAQFVSFGYLDQATLVPVNPVVIPPTAAFTAGQVSVLQGSTINNEILVSNFVPPALPAVIHSNASTSNINTSLSPSSQLILLNFDVPEPVSSTILPTDQVFQALSIASGSTKTNILQGVIRQSGTSLWIDGVTALGFDESLSNSSSISAHVEPSDGVVSLREGNVLFVATTHLSVETPSGDIVMEPGSVVFLMVTPDSTNVYNLHDGGDGNVQLIADGTSFCVKLGNEALITSRAKSTFSSFIGPDLIPVRGLKSTQLRSGRNLYGADFSIPSALGLIKPLRELKVSTSAQLRMTMERIIRDAAILTVLTSANGPYSRGN